MVRCTPLLFALLAPVVCSTIRPAPVNLKVEGLEEPVAVISEPKPRFSFLHGVHEGRRGITQQSYRITVSEAGKSSALWDSGDVKSSSCSEIEYGGSVLEPFQAYKWTVKYTDTVGIDSAVATASFETGPLVVADWHGAKFLQGGNQFRYDFVLPEAPVWARAYILAPGCHHLEVNGQVPIPDTRGICPWAVDPTKNVRFMTRDITAALTEGRNTLGLLSGSVMASPAVLAVFAVKFSDKPATIFTTGAAGWSETNSYVVSANAWSTTIDWSRHDSEWSKPSYTPSPKDWRPAGTQPNSNPPRALGMPLSTVLGEVKPTSVEKVGDASFLYTFPKVLVGTLKVSPLPDAQTGSKLEILSGEWLVADTTKPARCQLVPEGATAGLGGCGPGNVISNVTFVSYGTPKGNCAEGFQADPKCDAKGAFAHVEKICLGHPVCEVKVDNTAFGGDPCALIPKSLAVEVVCTGAAPGPSPAPQPSTPQISGPLQQYENHILRNGNKKPLETLFCWHGFQYVLVSSTKGRSGFKGRLEDIVGLEIYTNISRTGRLNFGGRSADILNGLDSMTHASMVTNVAAYMPTDCPTREKHGWLGDALDASEQALYNYDMRAVHESFMQLMEDNQGAWGDVPSVIPGGLPGKGSCSDIAWTAAYPLITNFLYKYYGDVRVIQKHYHSLTRFISNLIANAARSPNDLAVCDQFGDWLCPQDMSCCTHQPVGSTCPVNQEMGAFGYVLSLRAMANMANIIGATEDAVHYGGLAVNATAAFHKTFYNEQFKTYGGDKGAVQSLTLPALVIGSAPTKAISDEIVSALDADVANPGVNQPSYTLRVGAVTSKVLLDVLSSNGKHTSALKLATQTKEPSWGWWWTQNATTCWEHWPGGNGWPNPVWSPTSGSRNHIFLCGGLVEWYWKHLVGLTPTSAAFTTVRVAPKVNPEVGPSSLVAEYQSVSGIIASSWKLSQKGDQVMLDVTLPLGVSSGIVAVPKPFSSDYAPVVRAIVTESGKQIWDGSKLVGKPDGITAGRDSGEAVEFDVTNGHYSFAASFASEVDVSFV